MGKHTVGYMLLALIWILCKGNVLCTATVDTTSVTDFVDRTDDTNINPAVDYSANFADVTTGTEVINVDATGNPLTTIYDCEWEITDSANGILSVTWSGDSNGEVRVDAKIVSPESSCKLNSNYSKRVNFSEKNVDIEVCYNEQYEISIKFENCSANETSKQIWTLPGIPFEPTDLKQETVTSTSILLLWKEPEPSKGPITTYTVRWNSTTDSGMVLTNSTEQTFNLTGLRPYVRYAIDVAASTKAGRGEWSKSIDVLTNIGVPYSPTALIEQDVSSTSVLLSWKEPEPSTGPITTYIIRWNSTREFGIEYTNSTEQSFNLTGLQPYQTYVLDVAASTMAGRGDWSTSIEVQTDIGVPHAPTDVAKDNVTSTSILLSWKEPEPSTGPITTYTVRWNSTSDSGMDLTNSTEQTFNLAGLLPYVRYVIDVAASTKAGRGEWSKSIEVQTNIAVPYPPTDLIEEDVSNTSVLLSWKEPEPSTGPITTYIIRWHSGRNFKEEYTNSTQQNFNLTGLQPYLRYVIDVAASTMAGRGDWSTSIEVQTDIGVPFVPTDLTQENVTSTSILLSWKEPEPPTGPITTYIVRWNSTSDYGMDLTNSTEQTFNLTGLLPYVRYAIDVAASTKAGTGEWSESIDVQTNIGVPHSPTNLTQKNVTSTSVMLSWKKPEPSTGPITTYTVRWSNTRDSWIKYANSTQLSYNLTDLLPYVNYVIDVAALTEAGRGEWSENIKVQTEIGVPHSPTDLIQNKITNTSVLISWKEPEPSTGPINTYIVRWNSNKQSGINFTNSTKQSFNVTDLLPYETYMFHVAASTKAGKGEWSKSIEVQTDVGVPTAARNLHSGPKTSVSLNVKWERPEFPNSPELNYSVRWRESSNAETSEMQVTLLEPSHREYIDYTIRDLLPYTKYVVRVFSITAAGQGPVSNLLEERTEVGVPQPAAILETKAWSNRSVLVLWKTEGVYPGPVDFSLQAWRFPARCSGKIGDYMEKEIAGNKTFDEWYQSSMTEVADLVPDGEYTFLIVLRTSATDGVDSNRTIPVRIAPEASSEPLNVEAECINSPTDLKVSWRPPTRPNGRIQYYLIQYGLEMKILPKPTKSESTDVYVISTHIQSGPPLVPGEGIRICRGQSLTNNTLEVKDMCKDQYYILTGLRPERLYRIFVRAQVMRPRDDSATGPIDGKAARPSRVCKLPAGIPYLDNTSRLLTKPAGPDNLILEWTQDVFSDYMGAIIRYAILVGRLESLGNATSGILPKTEPPWSNFSSGSSDFYQATPLEWNPFTNGPDPLECLTFLEIAEEHNRTVQRCFIGIQTNCPENETYCNGPLNPDTPYEMKIRAFTKGGYTETNPMLVRSGPAPSKSATGTVVAIVLVLLVLTSLVAGIYIMNKKGYIKPLRDNILAKMKSVEEPKVEDPEALQMEQSQSVFSKPVKIKNFVEHIRNMMSDSHLLFSLEFEELKKLSPQLPCSIAETDENRSKNRWMNIFPFDHSRVKLLPLCDEPGSDFINANYIPGYSSRREFIATQGPLPHTVDDFWRMVWEQSVTTIVMLTQCAERGKKKCEKYWPDSGESQYYNDLKITSISESMLSSFIIRIFHIQLGSYQRHVKQMHFTHWPDFGCPECPEDLINFVNAVRDHLPRAKPGPILVHCSAGVGRTGTFIAVDRMSLHLRNLRAPEEDTIDIYGTIFDLRNHRVNMVQTEDQYIYIHLCVRQLILDMNSSQVMDSDESIYSNVGIERDTPI